MEFIVKPVDNEEIYKEMIELLKTMEKYGSPNFLEKQLLQFKVNTTKNKINYG